MSVLNGMSAVPPPRPTVDRAQWSRIMSAQVAATRDAAAASLAAGLMQRMRGEFTLSEAIDLFKAVRRQMFPRHFEGENNGQ